MKLIIIFLAAALILHLPFLEALQCKKFFECETQKGTFNWNTELNLTSSEMGITCDHECAAWECLVSGVIYRYYGCDEDQNICANKEKIDPNDYYFHASCNNNANEFAGRYCAYDKLNKMIETSVIKRPQLSKKTCNYEDALRPTKGFHGCYPESSDGIIKTIMRSMNKAINDIKRGNWATIGCIFLGMLIGQILWEITLWFLRNVFAS